MRATSWETLLAAAFFELGGGGEGTSTSLAAPDASFSRMSAAAYRARSLSFLRWGASMTGATSAARFPTAVRGCAAKSHAQAR